MHDASVIPNHHITNGPAMRENEPIIRSVRPEPIEKRFAFRNWHVNDIAVAPTTEEQRFALRQRVDADQRVMRFGVCVTSCVGVMPFRRPPALVYVISWIAIRSRIFCSKSAGRLS